MGFFSTILAIVSNLPQIIGIVSSIVALVKQLHPSQQPAAMAALREAYGHAVLNKGDTSKLDAVHATLSSGGPFAPVGLG